MAPTAGTVSAIVAPDAQRVDWSIDVTIDGAIRAGASTPKMPHLFHDGP
jgi:hypothetical protein